MNAAGEREMKVICGLDYILKSNLLCGVPQLLLALFCHIQAVRRGVRHVEGRYQSACIDQSVSTVAQRLLLSPVSEYPYRQYLSTEI